MHSKLTVFIRQGDNTSGTTKGEHEACNKRNTAVLPNKIMQKRISELMLKVWRNTCR